jgi:hypothetical protein
MLRGYPVSSLDVSQLSSLAYRNFIMTYHSAATRKAYVRCLDHFMKYLKIDTYDKLLDRDLNYPDMSQRLTSSMQ